MLHCLNTSSGNVAGSCSDNMTVLERQRERERERIKKWEQHQHGTTTTGFNGVFPSSSLQLEADSGMGLGLPTDPGSGFDVNSVISRTYSCPPALEAKHKLHMAKIKFNSSTGKEISTSFSKRKADKPHNTKVVAQNDHKDKRIKVGADGGESKITGQTSAINNDRETCADTCSKENSKASEVQKQPDYIHVRARRGQATDSHSLAERIRRGKISERMKYLQDLVPGCHKITGKAGMLDEIINYVQSLQRQVEFLSMKLAAVNPRLDFNMDDLVTKEMVPAWAASNFPIPTIGMSSEMTNPAAYLHFNSPQQVVPGCGFDTGINPPDVGLRRTISAPVSVSMPETFLDSSSCFTQILPSSTWDGDFQNLLYNVAFDQARATSFPSQLFTGLVEASNLKMEM